MNWFNTLLGDPQSNSIKTPRGLVQSYDTIKQKCLERGQLFEDTIFSPRGKQDCVWLRPHEISSNPKFVSSGVSRFDVVQGELGDCWLVAAIANLTLNQKLFSLVVPPDQTFDRGSYCGIFRFRFWQFGKWVEVVVDDRLPTRDGSLLFMRSTDKDEFWSSLFEKAYAKLHGSYDALRGGTTCEAMVDLSGGITEFFNIQTDDAPANLFGIIKKGFARGSLIGCSVEAKDESERENELPNGLVKGHAYSVTGVLDLDVRGQKIPMLRLRNPWSGTSEWNGPWSDKSREWSMINDREKQRIGLTFDADGEFWMSFSDFKNNFTRIEMCNLTPDDVDSNARKQWHQQLFEGSWIKGQTAGGCRNNLDTFAKNPQYVVTLVDPDEDDDEENCTMIVALMQKNRRSAKKYQMGSSELTIGFAIYVLKDGAYLRDPVGSSSPAYGRQQLLSTDFFKYNSSVARSPTYINLRELTSRFSLPPGTYAIIPSTFDKDEEGEFILRVWTEAPVSAVPKLPEPGNEPSYPITPGNKPTYPDYPTAENKGPEYPPYPNPSSPNDVRYPTLPEEPSIIKDRAPQPPPGPNIDIGITEVIGIISGIVSMMSMCWSAVQRSTATSQTYPYGGDQRQGVQPVYAGQRPIGFNTEDPSGQAVNNAKTKVSHL